MSFLFWLYGLGIFLAVCQDIKRREVDNWLNIFLLISGSAFIVFNSLNINFLELLFLSAILIFSLYVYFGKFEVKNKFYASLIIPLLLLFFLSLSSFIYFFTENTSSLLILIFSISLFFLLSNFFYFGHFFAGGDAKLLFSMAPLFVALSIKTTILNSLVFLFLLMLAGSIYGLVYSFSLGIIHFKKIKKVFFKVSKEIKLKYFIFFSILSFLIGLVNFIFYFLGVFILLFSLLYVFAKSLEKVAMYHEVSATSLREGDWLVNDLRIGKKLIRANFEGLTNKEIKLLRNYKRKVLIKGGLPFVPAFAIAFIFYVLFRDIFLFLFKIFL